MRQSLIDHLRKKRPLRNTGWGGYHPTALDPKEAERVVDALVEWLRQGTVPTTYSDGSLFNEPFFALADLLSEES